MYRFFGSSDKSFMKIKILLLFFLCTQCCIASAQDVIAIKKQLLYTKEDTTYTRLLNDLASAFYFNYEYDSCKKYSAMALQRANKLLNSDAAKQSAKYNDQYKMLKAKALENFGSAYTYENVKTAEDSLRAASELWNETKDKNGMASAYQRMGEFYMNQNNLTTSLKYFNASLNLYNETNDKQNISTIYFETALVERYMGNYGDALENNISALAIAKEIKDTKMMVQCLLANGFIYMLVKNYTEALKNQHAGLSISIAQKDSDFIATAFSDIGVTNFRAGNLDTALKYHLTSLKIRKQLNLGLEISSSYAYIALILAQQGKYKEALANDLEGLKYAQQHGDARYIMDTYNDIAVNYFSLNDYENALKNYDTLLKKSIKINDNYRQSIALQGIADIYLNQAKTKQAIALLQKAVTITDTSDYRNLRTIYKNLSTAYVKTGDYKNAYESSMKYKRFSDSVASKEKTDKLTGITHQLEFENKQALLKASQDKQLAVQKSEIERQKLYRNATFAGLFIFIILAVFLFLRFREKRKLNITLQTTLSDLKSMQSQLIQSEKMASLGELTAGISHEIQNPLNFVTNFSEVSNELIDEMKKELAKGNYEEVNAIAEDVKQNLEKINYHGKRADAIVKGMLQHSRKNSGVKESTDINKLADEYLRLSYHGLRAKDPRDAAHKSFNATMKTDFDVSIGKINIVSQDIGRVLLNLYNNAFYAVNEKIKSADKNYQPTVSISTKKINNKIEIKVSDNGNGIPQNIVDKIFQPFFTTKPTGQGTGLGLSLSYDIVKAHGGEIKVESKAGEGTTFIIQLPVV